MLGPTLSNPLLPFGDKVRTLRLRRYARRRSLDAIFNKPPKKGDKSIYAELRRRHFTDAGFIDNFARPFFGGILLDRELSTSARMLLFTFKMLASGKTAIPEQGMGAIARQLAEKLPPQRPAPADARRGHRRGRWSRRRRHPHRRRRNAGRGRRHRHRRGERRAARRARPAQRSGARHLRLLRRDQQSLYSGPRLVLNANPGAFVNNAVQLTNVSPTYGPKGQHLISCTVLGLPEMSDDELWRRCREDLASWFPSATCRGQAAPPRHLPHPFRPVPPRARRLRPAALEHDPHRGPLPGGRVHRVEQHPRRDVQRRAGGKAVLASLAAPKSSSGREIPVWRDRDADLVIPFSTNQLRRPLFRRRLAGSGLASPYDK